MNLDAFQLAFGAKPQGKTQLVETDEKKAVMERYPRQHWDSATDGGFGWENPFPYSIIPRVREVERACNGEQSRSTTALEEPLKRIAEIASKAVNDREDNGMTDTAAFAHCVLAKRTQQFVKKCKVPNEAKNELASSTERWRQTAAKLSAEVSHKECTITS